MKEATTTCYPLHKVQCGWDIVPLTCKVQGYKRHKRRSLRCYES